jgi:hypothetical protein
MFSTLRGEDYERIRQKRQVTRKFLHVRSRTGKEGVKLEAEHGANGRSGFGLLAGGRQSRL